MTAHELFSALFWIVAGAYVVYVGWFIHRAIRDRLGSDGDRRLDRATSEDRAPALDSDW